MPACTLGCRVFTRPSRISGNPVTSETLVTFTFSWASSWAVPPVERISTPWVRSARASSTWVRTMVRTRLFSHGFCTKSRAPRRIASTATSTLPQAVITTMGRVESCDRSCEMRSSPSWPDVVSRA